MLTSTRWLIKLKKKERTVGRPESLEINYLHSPSCLLTSVEGEKVVEMNERQRQNDNISERQQTETVG